MAEPVFLAAYDGKDQDVVDFAVSCAKQMGARLAIVHVLEWSPYSFLTPEELAQRHAERERELARARDTAINPILEKVRAAGVEAEGIMRHGHVVDLVCAIAREKGVQMIFVGRSNRRSARVFGSVASGLAQCAPVPVVIVP